MIKEMTLTRQWTYEGIKLPPPPDGITGDPAATQAFHANFYPAIATATLEEGAIQGGKQTLTYLTNVGRKG